MHCCTERYQTASGVIAAGISSEYITAKRKNEYIDSLELVGTAFYPLQHDDRTNTLNKYETYYDDRAQSIATAKRSKLLAKSTGDPSLKIDRRREAKAGMNGCGFAIGATRDITTTCMTRLSEFILNPKHFKISKMNQLRIANSSQDVIDVGNIEVFYSFDASNTSKLRGRTSRTQVHVQFGGLEKYLSGYVSPT